MSRNAVSVMCCGLLIALLAALQGCIEVHTADPSITAGDTLEAAVSEDLTDEAVASLGTELAVLAEDPGNQDSLQGVLATLRSSLSGLFDSVTDEVVANVDNGLLTVNISMVPVKLLAGAITLIRSKDDDTRGPIFALQLPLALDGSLDQALVTNDLLKTPRVHIEGYAKIVLFCQGYIKLLINQQGYKFYLEVAWMMIWKVFQAEAIISVSDDNVIRVMGNLSSWFTEEWGEQVAQTIRDAAKPFTDAIQKASDDVEAAKADCPDCIECDSVWSCIGRPFTCLANEVCKGVLNLAIEALEVVEKGVGAALEGAAWLVENAVSFLTQIFCIHEASFDLVVTPDDIYNSCLDLDLDVTIFGYRFNTGKVHICLNDIVNEIKKLARRFASGIFEELDSNNTYVMKYRQDNSTFDAAFPAIALPER